MTIMMMINLPGLDAAVGLAAVIEEAGDGAKIGGVNNLSSESRKTTVHVQKIGIWVFSTLSIRLSI